MDVRRVRRGDNGLKATLILFVFLFFVCAALAVVFYMQAQDRQSLAEEAEESLNQVATAQDRGSDQFSTYRAAVSAGDAQSVFGAMRSELEGLKILIAGEADATRETINTRLNRVGVEDDDIIVRVLSDMTNELDRLEGALENATVRVQAAESQLDDAQEQLAVEQASHESEIEELQAAIDQIREDYDAYQEQVANQRDELSRRLDQARDEAEEEIRSRDNQISGLENQLAERDTRIRQLIQEIGADTPDVPDATRQADGRVVSVSNERNLAYIDLGRRHHMVLGMRFEVFDRVRGVHVDEEGEMRGKATIEIVDISEGSSAGRIIRSSLAQPVLAGDPIANLVFDRDRQFKFFVFGEFDLDNDGETSAADRETITTLIREWGGTVVDPEERRSELAANFDDEMAEARIVPPDVDFVVVGREPSMPNDLPPGERDAVRIQENLGQQETWERYNRIVDAAQSLNIPVLNANRFLALIGYTGD